MMLHSHFSYTFLLLLAALATIVTFWHKRDKLGFSAQDEKKMPETRHFVLPDSRQIAYGIYGEQNSSSTVFYFHGCPSSHHEAFLLSEAGRRNGLRIIAPSRPGSGGSTFHENRALLDYPNDILALADYLKVAAFGIIAVSGGAPYAFACRKQIPEARLKGIGIVAGMYPVSSLGTAGMKLPSRLMLRVATWFPSIVGWAIDKQLGAVARDDDEKKMEEILLADMQHDSTSQNDKLAWEAASPEIRRAVVTSIREGVRYGGRGPAWEMKLFGTCWGFGLDEVRPNGKNQLVLWHGDMDANVPLAMAEKAAGQLGPDAKLKIIKGQGHGTLTFHLADEITATMKEMLRKS